MIKKLVFSMILILSYGAVHAARHSDDEQKKAIEKLAKKVLQLQVAEKYYQVTLDEIVTEVACQVDDSRELDFDKKSSNNILVAGGIIVSGVVLGVGGYLLYNFLMRRQHEIRNKEQEQLTQIQEPHNLRRDELHQMSEHLRGLRAHVDQRQLRLRQEREREQQRGDEYFNRQRELLAQHREITERLHVHVQQSLQEQQNELRRIENMTSLFQQNINN